MSFPALGDTDDDDNTPVIATTNGVYAYNSDWNDIEKSTRPTRAAATLMHRARQRTDTSRWWSMRWPSDAVSLLGRACDTGKTYELLRQLRELSVTHLRQLWRLTTERRQLGDDSGARQLTQAEWGETKRRLGPTGRNAKRKLMPGWATVAKLPLYKLKRLLAGWKRVRTAVVLRGGQRTIDGFVTKHARSASGRDGSADGDAAAPAAKRDCTDLAANHRTQTEIVFPPVRTEEPKGNGGTECMKLIVNPPTP